MSAMQQVPARAEGTTTRVRMGRSHQVLQKWVAQKAVSAIALGGCGDDSEVAVMVATEISFVVSAIVALLVVLELRGSHNRRDFSLPSPG